MRRVFRIPFSRSRLAREVDDELAFHLETRIDRLVAEGLAPDAARAEALRQFGALDHVREQMLILDEQRETIQRRANMFGEIRQDLTYGIRTLRRNAGFTALVIGGLALGIGANAAIFSLIDAVLLRELPVARPEQLVIVGEAENVDADAHGTPAARMFSVPLYEDVRKNNDVFTGVLASGRSDRLDVRIDSTSEALEHPVGRLVSDNFFSLLGVRAVAGRTFDSTDAAAATISYAYWTRRFHNDPSVIGRTVVIDRIPVAITGVAPPSFVGEVVGEAPDVWLPIALHDALRPSRPVLRDRNTMWLLLIGRMKPGVTIARVRQHLVPLIRSSILANATSRELGTLGKRGLEFEFTPGARGESTIRYTYAAPLGALMAGVALLLCVVCVNVANLLLARGIARRREMSLRLAIGANRARIVRQLLTESLLLALASGAAALLVAWAGSRALIVLASVGDPAALGVGANAGVLGFTLALSVLSVVLFGLVPALRSSRVDLATTLRATSRSVTRGAGFGRLLIAAQVAVSFVLLASAMMLSRSLRRVESSDLGFDRDHLIVANMDIATAGYSGARLAAAAHALRDRVAALPGVADVTFSENGLFMDSEWSTTLEIPGFAARTPEDTISARDDVGPGYARAIGARIIAGRDLEARDEAVRPRVAVVNATFARFYFPDGQAVGHFVHFDDTVAVQIVGVMSDVRGQSLDAPTDRYARRFYVSYVHAPDPAKFDDPGSLRMIVRTSGAPSTVLPSVRRALMSADPALPLDDIEPLTTLVRASIGDERLVAQIATGLGALALLLAAIGLYGVVSYTIARRTNEIGVRIALGARGADIGRMVLRDALRPVVIGLVLGLPLAIAAMRALERNLANVHAADPASVAIAVAVLAASAVVATLAPARRATRVDPIATLRED